MKTPDCILAYASAVKNMIWFTNLSQIEKYKSHYILEKYVIFQVSRVLPHFLSGGGTPNPGKNTVFGKFELEVTSPKKELINCDI